MRAGQIWTIALGQFSTIFNTTLEWVAWFNHHRLLEPIGNIPPAEAEANYYRQLAESEIIV